MSILIELEAVLNVINEAIRDQDRSLSKVKDRILALPTIEAETKHGRWIKDEYGIPHCSECGTINNTVYKNYCPNCGADMREKDEVEDG